MKQKVVVSKGLEIKITKEYTSKRLYSNYVHVSRSQYDISLMFCDIQSVITMQDKQPPKSIDAPVQVEVVIPASLLDPFIDALNRAKEASEVINEAIKE